MKNEKMNYVQQLREIEDKFIAFLEKCDNKLVGNIEYNEEEEYVKLRILTNFHCQTRFEAERKFFEALTTPEYCGPELRELLISFKLNEKYRFDPMQWSHSNAKKTISMREFEDGFEDFLISNIAGYKKDLEKRHEQNLKRIEQDIEKK